MDNSTSGSYDAGSIGESMYGWAKRLFPICRSITGPGVRETLEFIKGLLPEMEIFGVPSGTSCFDWIIPDEWTIRDAYVATDSGERVIDFRKNNLHVVGYSIPIDRSLSLVELQQHLHSRPDLPDAIPYVTSYYEKTWGFCLSHRERLNLTDTTKYRVVIDSSLSPGELNYGELIIPGISKREIFISTYVCHPSLANNELSGPVVAVALALWLKTVRPNLTIRIVWAPETIGSLAYLSKHLAELKENTVAGINLTCVGDTRSWSFMPSRNGDTVADRTARHVLRNLVGDYKEYSYLERGSDERQYCSPGVDLPFVSIMRSKYGEYPEYHTSMDDLNLISASGLGSSFNLIRIAINSLLENRTFVSRHIGEPHMAKHNLYGRFGQRSLETKLMMDFLAYADGHNDLLSIAEKISHPVWELVAVAKKLEDAGLLMLVK